MLVYLITHAHTQQQPAVDSRKWQLSKKGRTQAVALADAPFWQNIAAVMVSSEPKTRLTAEPAAERYGLPIYVDERLDELRRSGWTEQYAETVRKAFAHPEDSIAGWEAACSAQQRALAALTNIETRFDTQTVAIVGHGLSLSLLRAWFLKQKHVNFDEWQRLPFATWACADATRRHIVQDFVWGDRTR